MSTIESGDGWELQDDIMDDIILLTVNGSNADYLAGQQWCRVRLPPASIDALRAMQPRFLPHLREQRAAVFSERARKGWRTRRGENKSQKDADIKTLIGMETV